MLMLPAFAGADENDVRHTVSEPFREYLDPIWSFSIRPGLRSRHPRKRTFSLLPSLASTRRGRFLEPPSLA